jgi:hypothetical protein
MNLSNEDRKLLRDMCQEHNVSFDKIIKLIDVNRQFQFKERRSGIYEAIYEIITSDIKSSER